MIVVNIVPTGIGAEIGGHAGDATPASNLLASVCDTLITHPNVVNASDINEMASNTLYVEGSILDEFLSGSTKLKRVKSNKILVAVNSPIRSETINAVSAARATIGINAKTITLDTPLVMTATMRDGVATGKVEGWQQLIDQVSDHDFDALAIATLISCDKQTQLNYFKNGGVNPWGGVEAKASRMIASALHKPVAHAPIDDKQLGESDLDIVCDPRIAPEITSQCFLHCILKGLHKAPRPSYDGIGISDVGALVSPASCWGAPHISATLNGVPTIGVVENKTVLDVKWEGTYLVSNYIEAAGLIKLLDLGMTRESVTRPLPPTEIL